MKYLISFYLSFLFALTAHAFTLTPMSVTFDTQGRDSSQTFQIENDSIDSSAIDLFMATREIDLDGFEVFNRLPADDKNFLIYPEQIMLKASEKRSVRVTWKGPVDFTVEKAFRFVAEQLPVKTEKPTIKKGAVINMLLKYVAAIYVKPKNALPNLKLKDPIQSDGKEKTLTLTFDNSGQVHQVLIRAKLTLKTPKLDKPLVLGPEMIPTIAGQNILAGHLRRFKIPRPKNLPEGPLQASFELQE